LCSARLRGLDRPQYRVRVSEIRVFYDITKTAIEVLAIMRKRQAEAWLAEEPARASPSGPGKGSRMTLRGTLSLLRSRRSWALVTAGLRES
ncbi:MAG TPA: hypothetical protein VKI41_17220, partial [Vicinamibacteria bacterium]|nr:hypothetical protein [Vicinamibacteria bacterium]